MQSSENASLHTGSDWLQVSADAYLRSILTQYAVNNAGAEAAAQSVYPTIARWGGQYLLGAEFSGSRAKGTAISLGTDADIFLSLTSTTPGTLGEMYESLFNAFQNAGYQPKRQNVSIGIKANNYSIDLVPGRRQGAQGDDHSLYRSKFSAWTLTNVRRHITYVSSSNRTEEIRVLKIWRQLQGLDFPSFLLELAVIDALKNARVGDLANNVWKCLIHLRDTAVTMYYIDPANTNNVVSDDVTASQRADIASAAGNSLKGQTWGDVAW
jgi:hypothetical protein